LALIYSDYLKGANKSAAKAATYYDFAVSQMDYILGNNPMNMSYLIGYGDVHPTAPHHRTAHGTWADSLSVPTENRHTLVGALVGGPGLDDSFENDRGDYYKNEVATDYNAGFTGTVARLWLDFGGNPIAEANFPAPEVRDTELYIEAKTNAIGPRHIEISAVTHNHTAWPARTTDNLKFRYWVDLTEEMAAGYTVNDVTVTSAYSQATDVSGLYHWSDNLYYAEISFAGVDIYPGGQSASKKEVQFRMSLPTNTNTADWDNSSDPSWDNYTNSFKDAPKIALYDGNTLVWGTEPTPGCGVETGINCAPTADNASATTAFETAVTIPLVAADSDGTIASYAVATVPANGTVSITGSTATYTPDLGYFGTDSFTFTATDDDAEVSTPATVSVRVEAPIVPAVSIDAPATNSEALVGSIVAISLNVSHAHGANVYLNDVLVDSRIGDGVVNVTMPAVVSSVVVKAVATDDLGVEYAAMDTVTLSVVKETIPTTEVTCEVTQLDQWGSGFVINPVTVTNSGTTAITEWQVELHFAQPITLGNAWNSIASMSSDGLTLSAKNEVYNGNLGAGASATFGMQGGHGGTFTAPTCVVK
jgi:hypothetical protein